MDGIWNRPISGFELTVWSRLWLSASCSPTLTTTCTMPNTYWSGSTDRHGCTCLLLPPMYQSQAAPVAPCTKINWKWRKTRLLKVAEDKLTGTCSLIQGKSVLPASEVVISVPSSTLLQLPPSAYGLLDPLETKPSSSLSRAGVLGEQSGSLLALCWGEISFTRQIQNPRAAGLRQYLLWSRYPSESCSAGPRRCSQTSVSFRFLHRRDRVAVTPHAVGPAYDCMPDQHCILQFLLQVAHSILTELTILMHEVMVQIIGLSGPGSQNCSPWNLNLITEASYTI
jgi:hypothetical protein